MTDRDIERLQDIFDTTNKIVTKNGGRFSGDQALIIAALIQTVGAIEAAKIQANATHDAAEAILTGLNYIGKHSN